LILGNDPDGRQVRQLRAEINCQPKEDFMGNAGLARLAALLLRILRTVLSTKAPVLRTVQVRRRSLPRPRG
jgi:hypothetical protein